MSLQVWLPLTNGTLKQQGLKNISATIGGTVGLTDVGKLGKCATIGTAAGGITLPASAMTSFTECSVAFWINITSWNTDWDTIFQAGLGSTPWNNYIFGILRNQGNYLCFTVSNGSSTSSGNYASSNLTVGQWMHLAFTYGNGKCKIYINGVLDKEYSTSITPNFAGITHIAIGRSTNGSNYQCKCKLNDFRIYDHCLSPMEVKELAKGLVLHYPLNRNGWGNENLVVGTNIASSTNGKVYNLSSTIPSGTKVTISCWIDADNIIMSGNKRIGLSSGITKTDGSGTQWFETWASYNGGQLRDNGSFHGRVSSTYTILGNMSSIGTYIQNLTSGTVSISQLKVEIGDGPTPWCPNSSDALATTMGLNSTTEYDCSGFCNNGTRTGTFNWTSDTPKYCVSTEFAKGAKITSPTGMIIASNPIFTCNFWINTPTGTYTQYSDVITFKGSAQFRMEVSNTTGTQLTWFNYPIGTANGISTNGTVSNDTWNMFTITCDGSNWKTYKNGVLATTTAITGTAWTPDGTVSLGDSGTMMKMSDVRIYATALSASDVKSLYQNCATIDPDGTIRGQIRS